MRWRHFRCSQVASAEEMIGRRLSQKEAKRLLAKFNRLAAESLILIE
jgi:hypothetical protein